jgi:hypothetical protein
MSPAMTNPRSVIVKVLSTRKVPAILNLLRALLYA